MVHRKVPARPAEIGDCDMSDRYWEGYRDGAADTRERFLNKQERDADDERKRLESENSRLLSLIVTSHRPHSSSCPDLCFTCDAIKELRRIVHEPR